MATICNQCGGIIPDIGHHNCFAKVYQWPHIFPNTVQPLIQPLMVQGQKCELCGSTAIDHTEALCKLYRDIKADKPTEEEE